METTKKECIAMLLAGGQGTRLGVLTKNVAKPAVPFGAKYRIIDFALSNCANSGIDTVGVLTQYQPFDLNQYIGNGQPWDLDRLNGGVFILPPFMRAKAGEWYKGTANAIYQNAEFIDKFNPDNVLILSGDHIYKMNYTKMLNKHITRNADCTIATIDVSLSEASRFGILSTKDNSEIIDFEEKPETPKSTKASMGIYIFKWSILKKYLELDNKDINSANDFGKNIIPKMLENNQRLFAYNFNGYWKDVGTISSLWEANMDILDPKSGINLADKRWKVFAKNTAETPQYIGNNAIIKNSVISEGAIIDGVVENSIVFRGAKILKNAVVRNSVIFENAIIDKDAIVNYSIIASNSHVGKSAQIGEVQESPKKGCQWQIAVVGPKVCICDNAKILKNEMIGD